MMRWWACVGLFMCGRGSVWVCVRLCMSCKNQIVCLFSKLLFVNIKTYDRVLKVVTKYQ